MQKSRWWAIGGTLFIGLSVAYRDRTNLSVALPQLSVDMGFAGDQFAVTASWVLTTFLVGLLTARTGSYTAGFMVLGVLVILGGLALLWYGKVAARQGKAT